MPAEGPYAQHQPWEQQFVRPGTKGLVLPPKDNRDQLGIDALLKMRNLMQRFPGPLESRPGQVGFINFAAPVHSGGRADDPPAGNILRVWGAGTVAYTGNAGAGNPIQTGLSGKPLTMVPFYTAISDDPWMIVADANRIFKVRVSDGLSIPVGLPAGGTGTAVPSSILTTRLASFDATDNTQAANWTAAAGTDQSDPPLPAGLPVVSDAVGVSGNAIMITTSPGSAAKGYSSIAGVVIAVNANVLQGGAVPASDDDLVHLWLRSNRPDLVSEIRVYLVCGTGFVPTVIPGTSTTQNQDAYVKAFRPSDWTTFVEQQAAAVEADQVIRENLLLEKFADDSTPDDPRLLTPGDLGAATQVDRQTSIPMQAGRGVWSEMGVVGVPLRRGDFSRIGTTAGRDWGTLTGLVVVVQTLKPEPVEVALDDFFLTGGYGPDNSDPGASSYKYRFTNYDPRSGAESNGGTATGPVQLRRQQATLQPVASSDPAHRQRAYRTGGTLNDDYYFVGESTTNGGQILDTESDDALAAAPTVPEDHFQPVPTVNSAGTTVLNQPCPVIFGPLDDMVFLVGDPERPGTLYACIPGEVDHWPDDLAEPVCPSSEQLMNGCLWGGAAWVFSRARLYAIYVNLVSGEGQTIRANPTSCTPGLAARYGLAVTSRGIAYVASDGIRLTQGASSVLISQNMLPLFQGETVEGIAPIDWTAENEIHLTFRDERLWLVYKGTDATYYSFALDMLAPEYDGWSGPHEFCDPVRVFINEDGSSVAPGGLVTGGVNSGSRIVGFKDFNTNGVQSPINTTWKTGAWDMENAAATKSMGDVQLDADLPVGTTLTVTTRINNDVVLNTAQAVQVVAAAVGRQRYLFNPFGDAPQRARNITIEGSASILDEGAYYLIGATYIPEPLTTTTRPTPWETFTPQAYVVGCDLLCDTGGENVSVNVEYDNGTSIVTQGTHTINAKGKTKLFLSWPAVVMRQVRVRPMDVCAAWILYDTQWRYDVEPPTIVVWDSNEENLGDTYYTGLDIDCNTFGLLKTIEVFVDNLSLGTFAVQTFGRQLFHVTLAANFGHMYKFVSTDSNLGQLYAHRWIVQGAPGEQTNWNQQLTTYGTNADKYLKALVIHCDTFGVDTNVSIEADGVVAGAVIVNAFGPKIVMKSVVPQIQGRIFRTRATSATPGRCWEIEPIFDEEPLALDHWSSQRIDHGQDGWHHLFGSYPCLRSTADVVLTLTSYNEQGAVVQVQPYTIPSTGGAKVKPWVPFAAAKGVLYQWDFTSVNDFFLYREESLVWLQPWGGGPRVKVKPFGTDDMDHVRQRAQGPPIPPVKPAAWIEPVGYPGA